MRTNRQPRRYWGAILSFLGLTVASGWAAVVGAEFYVGTDPGPGNGTALSLTEGGSLAAAFDTASISLSSLTPGTYDVGVRVQDDESRWSNAIIRRFTLSPGDYALAGGLDPTGEANQGVDATSGPGAFGGGVLGEYFIGTDPGPGNGTALSLTEGGSLAAAFDTASISLSALTPGTYEVGVRVQDDESRWSNAIIRRFTLSPGDYALAGGLDPTGDANQGVDATSGPGAFGGGVLGEYFIGTDPGPGNGTVLSLTEGGSLAAAFDTASISLSALTPGTYDVGLRVQDDENRWSNAIIRRFIIRDASLIQQTIDEILTTPVPLLDQARPHIVNLTLGIPFQCDVPYTVTIADHTLTVPSRPFESVNAFLERLVVAINSDPSMNGLVTAVRLDALSVQLTALDQRRYPEDWVTTGAGLTASLIEAGSMGSEAREIVAAEYFVNQDPQPGNATALTITNQTAFAAAFDTLPIDVSTLLAGGHRIGVRFQNARGEWGNPVYRSFQSFTLFGTPDTTAPVIALVGSSPYEIPFGGTFTEPGFSATDETDGDVTSAVVTYGTVDEAEPGDYPVNYEVTDRSGNSAQVIRTVRILDADAPLFSGASDLVYTEPPGTIDLFAGLSAADDQFGNVSHRIELLNTDVDWFTPGTYSATFRVTDPVGNFTEVTRQIIVGPQAIFYPTFDAWIAEYAASHGLGGTSFTSEVDSDGDGLTNGVEWQFDTDPFDRDSKIALRFTRSATTQSFEWESKQRIKYKLYESTELETWSPMHPSDLFSDEDCYFVWSRSTPGPEPTKGFFRIEGQPRAPIFSGDE